NTFMEVLSGSSFDVSSLTGSIEDSIGEVFESLASNDFDLTMRLYPSDESSKGGVNLPSIYELIESLVKPKLGEAETFTAADAKDTLYLMYKVPETDAHLMDKTFNTAENQDQAQDFLDEINDKFYIVKDSALAVSDLFGDGTSGLSEKIKADSIYFKPTEAEAAKWTGEKKALYTDTRTSAELRASLTGSEIAALVGDSNLIPSDMIASFGSIEVLGAAFETKAGKTYLTFNMKLLFNKESSGEGEEAIKYGALVPDAIKLSAKILLYADSYTEAAPRYSTTIVLNNDPDSKVFMLMHALGGEDLSEKAISDKIAESIATTFNTLEGKVPLYYQNAGAAYTAGTEECIKVADVFTFLVKETSMKDSAEENAPLTDPDALAARLRGFGQQTKFDAANEGVYTWMGDLLKLFADTDDDYIYQNMQRAYFLNETPVMDDVYNDFASKFSTIKSDTFNLNSDENGLFYYNGNILNLKVSDRALAVIVKEKQSLAAAASGEGMTVELMSLKLYHEDAKLVIESGVKICFDGRDSYKMMPDYFFVIAKTKSDGLGGFTTTVSMNNLTTGVTDVLFQNISSLSSKGMTSSFDKTNIETTINNAISTALGNFPNSVTFGEFTSSDVTSEYNATIYGNTIRVAAGDGYISFPSVYSYLIDMFYTSEEAKPLESEMQSMLVHLHAGDSAVESAVVTNPMNAGAYHAAGFTGSNPMTDATMIFSDRYLASEISTRFSAVTLQDGKISLGDSIKQTILLRGLGESEALGERATWESKFFSGGSTYVRTDNYMIATACVSLDYYNSGDKTNLLPENLWFTVLADLDTTANSEGLLYDMSIKDMEIFQHILSKSNNFNIKAIAMEFAGKIKEQINAFVTSILPGANVAAHLAADEFVYFESYLHTENEYKLYANTEMMKLMSDDKPNGIGYLVLSAS
ncbi:MAG: hypothetical protein J5765_01935, partial [Clostridia bacterium]|nr:hypothetical protein [Clostridia bacterium]